MYKWIENLVDAYDKMFVVELPKKPTVYKIGNKRYIRTKKISKRTVGRVRYIKKEEE
jgi:hypothetical protein|tara:strand:- start:327 stop:497 length:171 start_codon:yes stop_codon:yes gene_type:complete